jgi:hypothetical protein
MRDRLHFLPPLWIAIGASAMMLAAMFFAHQAALFRVSIVFCAVWVGLTLYVRNPKVYLQFALWVCFLTPLARRMVDLKFGYQDQNLVLLCPLLVTAIAALALLECSHEMREVTPFLLCISGVLYGLVIGLIRHASADVIYGFFSWLAPVVFGLSVYLQWPDCQTYHRAIERTFLLGVLVMGAYGIFQYCAPPRWDVYWWQSLPFSTADSFGRPFSFKVRVWSTLNAPAPFAAVMGAGLLLNMASRSRWAVICNLAGLGSLLLSLSRTEWVACAFGFLFILSRASGQFLKKTILAVGVLAIVSVPLLSVKPVQETITQRLGSFQHLSQDESIQGRSAMYDRLAGDILRDPFGQGLSNSAVYDGYALDSGLLRILLRLGMIGTLFYLAGIGQIASRLLARNRTPDNIQVVCGAILLAALLKFVSVSVFENGGGAVLWLCMGLGLASRRFYGERVEEIGMRESYVYAD